MATDNRKSRKSNFSQEEVDVLITTVMQNRDLLYGGTSKNFFHKEVRNQVWNIILEEVNKVSLERRTLNEIKNKWKKCQFNVRTAEVPEGWKYVDGDDDLDSMPLQQRLSQNHNEPPPLGHQPQETVLQSQPISPTKLKVTRQGKPQAPPPRMFTPPLPPPPEVCLRWDSHHMNMQSALPSLLTKEQYVDATLVSEGKTLKCHRMILSACSPYFEDVLSDIGPLQHPVLFMKDVPFWILKALCDFMYAGEVHILQDKLQEFLRVASTLKIKGLCDPPGTIEDIKPVIPTIKQEFEATPAPLILEKPLKQEKEDEPPPPAQRPIKLEVTKSSKKKEDKKSRHSSHTPKEKEKVVEEPPPPKVPTKIVTKVVLPKVPPSAKAPVRNVMRNVAKPIPKLSTSKTSHNSRKNENSRQKDKHKVEVAAQREKEKAIGPQKEKQEKEKLPLKKDNINDPLDLLRPVYEEIAKYPPQVPKNASPGKLKERANVPVKKTVNKKVKKRRYAEYAEDREESPPPVFLSRKGTRSRPNVKIPKFFHTHFDDSPKETTDATIVREPHTDQNDPLIGAEMDEIKAEPLDVEENTIEMEANIVSVNYLVQDQEMISQEGEEIIGNYDSPLVNIKREPKANAPNIFKKEIDEQPVIMDVHTVTETDDSLLNIKQENLDRLEETIIGSNFDTPHAPLEKPSEIIISNVQSMAGVPEETNLLEKREVISEPTSRPEEILPTLPDTAIELPKFDDSQSVGDFSKSFVSVDERTLESTKIVHQAFLNVSKETDDNLPFGGPDPLASTAAQSHGLDKEHELMETDEAPNPVTDNLNMEMERGNVYSEQGTLGSLEARVEALAVESQGDGEASAVCDDNLGHKIEPFGSSSEELVRANNTSYEITSGSLQESQNNVFDNNATEAMEKVTSSPKLCKSEDLGAISNSEQAVQGTAENLLEEHPESLFPTPLERVAEDTPDSAENSQKSDKLNISDSLPENCNENEQTLDTVKEENSLVIDSVTLPLAQSAPIIQDDEASAESTSKSDENSGETDCAAIPEVDCSDKGSQSALPAIEQADSLEQDVEISVATTLEADSSIENNVQPQPEIEYSDESRGISTEQAMQSTPDIRAASAKEEGTCEIVDLNVNQQRPVDFEANLDVRLDDNIKNEASEATDQDYTENIEAELEKCLASTSSVEPLKSSEGRLKVDAKPLPFEDDDDFSSFIGGNRPANYLGDDFGTDFEMNQLDDMKHDSNEHCHKSGSPPLRPDTQVDETGGQSHYCHDGGVIVEERKLQSVDESTNNDASLVGDVDMNEPYTLNIDNKLESRRDNENVGSKFDDQTEKVAKEAEMAGSETVKETTTEEELEPTENNKIVQAEKRLICESASVGCEKLEFNRESEEERSEEKPASVTDEDKINFNLGVQSEINFSLDQQQTNYCNQEAKEQSSLQVDRKIESSIARIGMNPTLREEPRLELILEEEQAPSTVAEKISSIDSPISADDEQRMEDTLLADLDDDIEMKDATASKEQVGSEKTLEMIVNDLNESLGDMMD